jgi:monoamine oxidase
VLLRHGVRVTILEGRTRVGGRVRCPLHPPPPQS